jgi:hypothetical protein
MARSRGRKPKTPALGSRARRRTWRRAAGGWAEFARNIALLPFGAPFIDPLLTGADLDWDLADAGIAFGLALVVVATIFDLERED